MHQEVGGGKMARLGRCMGSSSSSSSLHADLSGSLCFAYLGVGLLNAC